jgi:hypothetical protein
MPMRRPRLLSCADLPDGGIRASAHPRIEASSFSAIGAVFSADLNPDGKKPFDIRALTTAVADFGCSPVERWRDAAGAESAVDWDAHPGGLTVWLIGIESQSPPRGRVIPADGPYSCTGATLFPRSPKKVARALNAATGNRPVVVPANFAGFDGSPESLRELQLEYGAEIGRAVTKSPA